MRLIGKGTEPLYECLAAGVEGQECGRCVHLLMLARNAEIRGGEDLAGSPTVGGPGRGTPIAINGPGYCEPLHMPDKKYKRSTRD